MTKKEIKQILLDSAKDGQDGWIAFEDPEDQAQFIKDLKTESLEYVFDTYDEFNYPMIRGREIIEDMQEEYESL